MPKKPTKPTVPAKPTKADIKKLEETLKSTPKLVWDHLDERQMQAVTARADDFKKFLNAGKTERLAAAEIIRRAEDAGFKPLETPGKSRKLYALRMGKIAALAVLGKKPVSEGLRLIVAHIDSPRLDLKPRPLYEDVDLALLKTHYYGGIWKHQWLSRPLALYGHAVKQDGNVVTFSMGDAHGDPVFTVADLLPHLGRKPIGEKKVTEAFAGEKLNLIAGCLPYGDSEVKERFKLSVLKILHERFGLVEEDFISAECELVPAGSARDVGFDAGLIGGYGQDDRICAYSAVAGLLEAQNPRYTSVALCVDKEEIGSDGATGAKSRLFLDFVSDLLQAAGETPTSATLRKTLLRSKAISADVEAATDPDWQELHDKNNAGRLGYGVCLTRYSGSGGKYNSSEASAEYLAWIRGVLNKAGVIWQSSVLGKVDEGGGGTVAMFLAEHGMNIVDFGPCLLAMHSPFEVSSKADLYMTVAGYRAFYEAE